MKVRKYIISLVTIPLLISCGKKGDIDFDHSVPALDVDNIAVGELTKDPLGGAINEDAENVYFDFYEVSDFHGAVNYSVDDKTIGLAKMADYFSKKRANNPGGMIVLSSGDMFQGSAESNLTYGYLVNYGMNIMGFEAMTLGNHEFDWGIDWLRKNSQLSVNDYKIPYLGANVFDKATGQLLDFLKPSTIIERNGYKVGIIGTLGDNSDKSIMKSLVAGLEFRSEVPIVTAEAQRLKNDEHCDVVVWSSHRDINDLANIGITKASGIDAVFGGHTHNSESKKVSEIPYLETKNMGKGIAHARLSLNKTSKAVDCVVCEVNSAPYAVEGLVDHPEVQKVYNVYNQYLEPVKNEVIGSTDGVLKDTEGLVNLCVETQAMAAQKWVDNNQNGEWKIVGSVHNASGGVRADINAGDIHYGDVYKSFPFDNEVVIISFKGSDLKNRLLKINNNSGVWRDVEVLSSKSAIVNDTIYYFATTDFFATNYLEFKEDQLVRTGYVVRDCVAARVKYEQKIKAKDFASSVDKFKKIS